MLVEILSHANPEAYARSTRVRQIARQIGEVMSVPDAWHLEVAAMLSQLGLSHRATIILPCK
jgi:hypothetical protein